MTDSHDFIQLNQLPKVFIVVNLGFSKSLNFLF